MGVYGHQPWEEITQIREFSTKVVVTYYDAKRKRTRKSSYTRLFCIGGPLHGQMRTDVEAKHYYQYNSSGFCCLLPSGKKAPTAVRLHPSVFEKGGS